MVVAQRRGQGLFPVGLCNCIGGDSHYLEEKEEGG